jgi:tetratricopeptide (TPR) repeat protein
MRFCYKTIIFVVVSIIIPSIVWPETIKLKSGQTIEGKIIFQDKKLIRLDANLSTPLTYFLDEIEEIKASPSEDPNNDPVLIRRHADELEDKAVDLIDHDRTEEGMALMKRAVEIDPTAMRHMNYASILFGSGAVEFKDGDKAHGTELLFQSQEHLGKAIAGFDYRKDAVFLSQAYFLLGEIYWNAFSNQEMAKTSYQKALTYHENQGAKNALAKLQN